MKDELKNRTKEFAKAVWTQSQSIGPEFIDFKRQLIRCSSSVGANYRAASRAKSTKDFLNKLKIVEEEIDESLFFIELIKELSKVPDEKWNPIYSEGEVLLKILVASILTVKRNQKLLS
jgi:four helix bundle protein